MLYVDTSSRLDGARSSCSVGSPVSRSQTDVLLSAVSLSSSPVLTERAEALLEGDRLMALRTENFPSSMVSYSVASSEVSDESSSMGDTERSLYADTEWLAYFSDIEEIPPSIASDNEEVPQEKLRHLEQFIGQQSLLSLSSVHHQSGSSQHPEPHSRLWNLADSFNSHIDKEEEQPRKCYYQRLLSMSKSGRKHNKRKAKQYRQAMKEKRSGLFKEEQVVTLHCPGDASSELDDEDENISVVD